MWEEFKQQLVGIVYNLETNENGGKLVNFVLGKSTIDFFHMKLHKKIWNSLSEQTSDQINHFLFFCKSCIIDVRILRVVDQKGPFIFHRQI